jgi:hypothetical protein
MVPRHEKFGLLLRGWQNKNKEANGMANEIAGIQVEELRLKNLRTQMNNRHNNEVREIQNRQDSETQRLVENHAQSLETLKDAYAVQISKEAESLETRLMETRSNNEARVAAEKRAGDDEVRKLQAANEEKLGEYKKNGAARMEAARKDLQVQAEALHQREIAEARKAKMLSKTHGTKA